MTTMQLVEIAPGHYLDAPAARAYLRALAAGCPPGITSSYRDPTRQAAMRAQYVVQLAAYNRGDRKTRPTYVAPVDASDHVKGLALDLPAAPRAWFRAHPDYGYVFTDPTENWHVAYRITRDKHLTDGTASPTSPALAPPTIPGGEMYLVEYGGTTYVVTPLSIQRTVDVNAAIVVQTLTGKPPVVLDATGWTSLQQQVQASIIDTANNLKYAPDLRK